MTPGRPLSVSPASGGHSRQGTGGAAGSEPLFPPDSAIRGVDAENVLLLGGGRALLMQLAHPLVAAGVADHSDFERDPWTRLRRTLEASYAIVFGTRDEAEAVARRLWAVHGRVTGPGYRANDPELLMWVHATLVDTAMRVHARFLRPLPPRTAAAYYRQSADVAELLGVPRCRQPRDLEAFRSYVRHMVGTLRVSDTARALARSVLHPDLPAVAAPATELARQLTAGLLPSPLRDQYGLRWSRPRQLSLTLAAAASRAVLPLVPAPVRRARVLG